jgi:hypothetical protein
MLKLAVLNGIQVVNNPFHNSPGDNFFQTALSSKIGIPVPRTVILPCKEHPPGTNSDTMRNMIYPISWVQMFEYVGFPAYIKPNIQDGNQNCYKVYNPIEFFAAYDLTGNRSMVLQESIEHEQYWKSFVIGKKYVKIMHYDPIKPLNLRYRKTNVKLDSSIKKEIEANSLKICSALDLDFNSIEFAVRKGIPYIIDFYNPAANCDKSILHESNFEWLVQTTSEYLIKLAINGKKENSNYSWNEFLNSKILEPAIIPKKRGRKKKIV